MLTRIPFAERSIPLILLAIAIASLSAALIAEYGFGLKPCILCLYQRIPYAIIGVIGILGLLLSRRIPCGSCLLLISTLVFLGGAGIAGFHVGVEHHWWPGPGCGGGSMGNSIEELKHIIMGAPAVRCDQPAFIFLGLSMAGWNFLYSLGLATFCLLWYQQIRHDKNRTR